MADLTHVLLDRVNTVRFLEGHVTLPALPQGVRRSTGDCVIQRALRDLDPEMEVTRQHIFIDPAFADSVAMVLGRGRECFQTIRGGTVAKVPINAKTRDFIIAFDGSEMPELVDEAADEAFRAFEAAIEAERELQPA